MDARVAVAGLIAIAACRGPSQSPRERVLSKLSPHVYAVLAAEGKALTSPAFHALVASFRTEGPFTAKCVIDAAVASDQIAVSRSTHGTTIVIATSAKPRCPELSKIDDGLWVATIGNGDLANPDSVLTDDRFARARKYLVDAPVALYVDDATVGRLLATAQPDPLEAWLAVDIHDPTMADAVEHELRGFVARLAADTATAVASSHVSVTRDELQVVARIEGASASELAAVIRAGLHAPPKLAPDRIAVMPPAPHCPHLHAPLVNCLDDGATLVMSSLAALADVVGRAELEPLVTSGQVNGLRVTHDIDALGLVAGDEIIEAEGRHVTRAIELVDTIRTHRGGTRLSFRRAGRRSRVAVIEVAP